MPRAIDSELSGRASWPVCDVGRPTCSAYSPMVMRSPSRKLLTQAGRHDGAVEARAVGRAVVDEVVGALAPLDARVHERDARVGQEHVDAAATAEQDLRAVGVELVAEDAPRARVAQGADLQSQGHTTSC